MGIKNKDNKNIQTKIRYTDKNQVRENINKR